MKDRLTITHAQVGSIKFEFLGRPEINDVNIVKKEKMNKKVFSPSGLIDWCLTSSEQFFSYTRPEYS